MSKVDPNQRDCSFSAMKNVKQEPHKGEERHNSREVTQQQKHSG